MIHLCEHIAHSRCYEARVGEEFDLETSLSSCLLNRIRSLRVREVRSRSIGHRLVTFSHQAANLNRLAISGTEGLSDITTRLGNPGWYANRYARQQSCDGSILRSIFETKLSENTQSLKDGSIGALHRRACIDGKSCRSGDSILRAFRLLSQREGGGSLHVDESIEDYRRP